MATGSVPNLLRTLCGPRFSVMVAILRIIRRFKGVLKEIEAIEAIVEYYQPFIQ
jgi:hypothetical protein